MIPLAMLLLPIERPVPSAELSGQEFGIDVLASDIILIFT
jgi:hypothetical protein